jgi:hypothetical protein
VYGTRIGGVEELFVGASAERLKKHPRGTRVVLHLLFDADVPVYIPL